jgi:PHD/YefM family antitoxin component YafN of YafNO toxin-antitoxin module
MEKTISATEASADLLEMLDDVRRGRQFVIKLRRRKAVLMDYERLRTLEALAELARDSRARASMAVPMRTCGPDVCTP